MKSVIDEFDERADKNKPYDQMVFSSSQEERKYIDNSTRGFSLIDCFLKHKNSNALILLDSDNEYCIEPVNIHMVAAMKLYRAIGHTNNYIEEELVTNNEQGNIIIRIVNVGKLKVVIPCFPRQINDYQLHRLESYLEELKVIVVLLNEDEKEIFREGIAAIERKINSYKYKESTKSSALI